MDGVFNHVTGNEIFPYHFFYRQLQGSTSTIGRGFFDGGSSPYVGPFDGRFDGLRDLDFNNACLEEFVRDVCFYWMDEFGIDGIRFDNTVNFFDSRSLSDPTIPGNGLFNLIANVNTRAADPNFSTILEHLEFDAALVTNFVNATSYWNNALYGVAFDYLYNDGIPPGIMNALNSKNGLVGGGKVATTYLTNHDHSHLAWQAGARTNQGSGLWFRTQPLAIALMTIPGSPMIQNGQEFAEGDIAVGDNRSGRRVYPRPLRWGFADDVVGKRLRDVYQTLNRIHEENPGLRSDNVYPMNWPEGQTTLDEEGYGVDRERGLVIYHRYGNDSSGNLQRFIIVLNFSDTDLTVSVPFSDDGIWRDLLTEETVNVSGFRADISVNSNWGRIYLET